MKYKQRFLYTFIIVTIFIVLFAIIKNIYKEKGIYSIPSHFWLNKVYADTDKDIVAIGDSRVYRGISSQPFIKMHSDLKFLNFGFSSAGLSKDFLHKGREKLSEHGKKILLIGVSASSLTELSAKNEDYNQYASQKFIEDNEYVFIKDMINILFGKKLTFEFFNYLYSPKSVYIQVYHNDGWIKSSLYKDKPESSIKAYEKHFAKNIASLKILHEFITFIKDSTEKGYKVYCFRPPTTVKMEKLVNERSHFDEQKIKKSITEAGGVWIDIVDKEKYISYDGSHLRGDSALLLSAYLANIILPKK